MQTVVIEPNFTSWRRAAREALLAKRNPYELSWSDDPAQSNLFAKVAVEKDLESRTIYVPREFASLAELVSCVRFDERWSLLYRLLYRISYEEKNLLKISVDPDVAKANAWAKLVKRDIHKMHAFVRFKSVRNEDREHFVAWHAPDHFIVRLATPFFARRFGDQPWTIFTPTESANWDLHELTFAPGIPAQQFAASDSLDEMWKSYYKSIFNPARLNLKAMRSEMAQKYWSHLPEAQLIHELKRQTPMKLQVMAANQNQEAKVPGSASLLELKNAARGCTACPLYKDATQTVFGEGSRSAQIVIVGEQPGNEEDLAGHPFVGPAGAVLNEAMVAAGLQRNSVYLTNAVKHFKFEPRGKMRLHKKPNGREMGACRPWLEAEIAQIKPKLIVALGATAGTSVLGRLPRIGEERGKIQTSSRLGAKVMLSWHPSAILRSTTPADRELKFKELIQDLKHALALVAEKTFCPWLSALSLPATIGK